MFTTCRLQGSILTQIDKQSKQKLCKLTANQNVTNYTQLFWNILTYQDFTIPSPFVFEKY